MFNKILPMTGVEPQTSGIKSNRSTNWATTTSRYLSEPNISVVPQREKIACKYKDLAHQS